MTGLRVVRDDAGSFSVALTCATARSVFLLASDQKDTRNYPHYPQEAGWLASGMRRTICEGGNHEAA